MKKILGALIVVLSAPMAMAQDNCAELAANMAKVAVMKKIEIGQGRSIENTRFAVTSKKAISNSKVGNDLITTSGFEVAAIELIDLGRGMEVPQASVYTVEVSTRDQGGAGQCFVEAVGAVQVK